MSSITQSSPSSDATIIPRLEAEIGAQCATFVQIQRQIAILTAELQQLLCGQERAQQGLAARKVLLRQEIEEQAILAQEALLDKKKAQKEFLAAEQTVIALKKQLEETEHAFLEANARGWRLAGEINAAEAVVKAEELKKRNEK